jgi:hypothetical protein
MLQLLGLTDITALGAILSAVTLLTVCKVSTDIMCSNQDTFGECVAIIVVGSLLSAVLLFTPF